MILLHPYNTVSRWKSNVCDGNGVKFTYTCCPIFTPLKPPPSPPPFPRPPPPPAPTWDRGYYRRKELFTSWCQVLDKVRSRDGPLLYSG